MVTKHVIITAIGKKQSSSQVISIRGHSRICSTENIAGTCNIYIIIHILGYPYMYLDFLNIFDKWEAMASTGDFTYMYIQTEPTRYSDDPRMHCNMVVNFICNCVGNRFRCFPILTKDAIYQAKYRIYPFMPASFNHHVRWTLYQPLPQINASLQQAHAYTHGGVVYKRTCHCDG